MLFTLALSADRTCNFFFLSSSSPQDRSITVFSSSRIFERLISQTLVSEQGLICLLVVRFLQQSCIQSSMCGFVCTATTGDWFCCHLGTERSVQQAELLTNCGLVEAVELLPLHESAAGHMLLTRRSISRENGHKQACCVVSK